ncbi:hypothetical protein [Mycolicibacterium sarraceniae]
MVGVRATEGVGPINAGKRSSGILRRTWGESWPVQADSASSPSCSYCRSW